MKTRLSALEELRIEKARLIEECDQKKRELLHNLDYGKNNFGRLVMNSAFSSTKNGVSDLMSMISGKPKKGGSKNPGSSGFVQTVLAISPIVWDIVQPMLLSLLVKKIKSVFTRKKKKK